MNKTLNKVSMLDFAYANLIYACKRSGFTSIDTNDVDVKHILDRPLEEITEDTKLKIGDVLVWVWPTTEMINCCVDIDKRPISSTFVKPPDYAVIESGCSEYDWYVSYVDYEYNNPIPRINTKYLCNMHPPTHRLK